MMGVVGVAAALGSIVLPIALNQLRNSIGFPWVCSLDLQTPQALTLYVGSADSGFYMPCSDERVYRHG